MEIPIGEARVLNGVSYTVKDIGADNLSYREKVDSCMLCAFYTDDESCFSSAKVLGRCLTNRTDGRLVIFERSK